VGRAPEDLGGGLQFPRDPGVHTEEMASFNWQSYNFDTYNLPQDPAPPGNLLLYPIQVEQSGEISNLANFTSFPDYPSTARVMGGKQAMIPDKITT